MVEFYSSCKAHGGGRDLQVVDSKTVKAANELYMIRSHRRRPSSWTSKFDPPVFKKRAVEATRSSSDSLKSWWNDPETKRKKRVAKYKFYAMEGKVKSSFKKGLKWIKNKYSKIVNGI